jgi:periplasmic protein CpxP/Spy
LAELDVLLWYALPEWRAKNQERWMSFIRNVMVALAVAAAIPAVASAQAPGPQGPEGAQRRGGGMQMLMKDITLSAEQQADIEKIGLAIREEMRAMGPMQPGTPPDSATRAKRDELRRKQYTEIRKVLTAEQQKTFDANLAEMEKRMQEMRRN